MGEPRIWTAEEAEALLAAATPGPWWWRAGVGSDCDVIVADPCPGAEYVLDLGSSAPFDQTHGLIDRPGDRAIIVAAPDLAASVVHHARRADEADAMIRRLRWQRDKAARWAGVDLSELNEAADEAGFRVEVSRD